jgi:putative tryptophan/tyrosine transport system substrate-binding protein
MRRIGLAIPLALGLVLVPHPIEAQQAGTVPRVALFTLGLAGQGPGRLADFKEGLRQLGYVEGRNLALEVRSAEGNSERLPGLATELVRLKVDVIVAGSSDAIRAAQDATKTIPIVMVVASDPVGAGFVGSLARPGGNITGFSTLVQGLSAKRLQLIKEAVPQVNRVGVLWRRANPSHRLVVKEMEEAARSLGLQLHLAEAGKATDLDGAFSAMATARVGAVLVLGDNIFSDQARRIIDLASRTRLPTLHFAKTYVEAGGLMSYATDQKELYRGAATFVDKILKGAKPADLPVEQPKKFELVINLKTAKALGLTIPQTLLLRADQVIQ